MTAPNTFDRPQMVVTAHARYHKRTDSVVTSGNSREKEGERWHVHGETCLVDHSITVRILENEGRHFGTERLQGLHLRKYHVNARVVAEEERILSHQDLGHA